MPGIVFDGDDTLWVVEPLYDSARSEVARIVAQAGLDPMKWEQLQRDMDVQLVATMGLAATRFPTSNVEAYKRIAAESGLAPDERVVAEIASTSQSVFDQAAPLVPGAEEVLEELRQTHRLALLTRGEAWVQERRIQHSGLVDYFDEVQIVPEKTVHTFREVVRRLKQVPSSCWSVGNSFPSDIQPALEAGLSAIWVEAHVWEYERRRVTKADGHVSRASSLRDVPRVIRPPRAIREA